MQAFTDEEKDNEHEGHIHAHTHTTHGHTHISTIPSEGISSEELCYSTSDWLLSKFIFCSNLSH